VTAGNLVLLKTYADKRGGAGALGDLLTFGRLHSVLTPGEKAMVSRRFGLSPSAVRERYTGPLLRELGAKSVQSLDISDHEKCDIVFDLTQDVNARPDLAARLVAGFDTVLDYGTSEHVFNFPQALVNAWNMLRDDGRYIFDLPITGWSSHGLYQFSPNYFHSLQQSEYFAGEHLYFHRKRGIIFFDIRNFDRLTYWRLNGHRKISCWGVWRKRRPAGMQGPLKLEALRVMQADVRVPRPGETARARNRTYGVSNIAAGFDRKP
jgi:hypothetical protein